MKYPLTNETALFFAKVEIVTLYVNFQYYSNMEISDFVEGVYDFKRRIYSVVIGN